MSEKMRKQALQLISEHPLSLAELAEKMSIKEKKAFNIIKHMFENELVISFKDQDSKRRYRTRAAKVSI